MTGRCRGALVAAGLLLVSGAGVGPAFARRRHRIRRYRVRAAAPPCARDLASCPVDGCAEPGTPEALLNRLKRRFPGPPTGTLLTLDEFAALQTQASARVGQRMPLEAADRALLKRFSLDDVAVNEGEPVAVTGYVVGSVHDNRTGETVNCRLKGVANNDFHITIARRLGATPYEGIVVEMIPQGRPEGWTLPSLKQVEREGRLVRVEGQLLYDNMHLVNADPSAPLRGQPPRMSLWEIHPVWDFRVCERATGACDPKNPADWTPIEQAP